MSEPTTGPAPDQDPPTITDPSEERASRELYTGSAHGGPLDGVEAVSRFPRGLVAVDKANARAWIYDYQADPGQFSVRDAAGVTLDEERRWQAAEGADYEVVAV